jgi:hypothetical protein
MSGLDLIAPFLVPVAFALVAIFGAWIYYAARVPWPEQPLAEGRIYRCPGCGHVYVEGRDVPMSRCPRCDRLNEAIRR